MENDLGRDPIRRLVLRIAVPSMLAQFVSVLYSVVDRMYIGNIPEVGNLALAGAGVCGPLVTMIGSVAFLVGVGGSPLVSIRMGAGDNEGAKRILANCFVLLAGLAAALTALAWATRRPVLLLFGASEASLPYAETYYSVYLTGTLFALLSTGMNQFIICQGFAKKGMLSVLLGAVLNILLDPVFIFLLDMGVAGAALATVLSQLASCVFVLSFLFGRQPPVRITFGGYSLRLMGRVAAIGFTPFIIIAFDNVMIIALNSLLQKYGGAGQGDLLVAAATIAQSFMLVVTMPLGGITGGTGSILGYNYGAGQPGRILEAQKFILLLCLGYTTLLFLIGQGAPGLFVAIFSSDGEVARLAAQAIRIYTLGVIPLAVQYTVIDGFTGMGMMQYALPLSFFRKAIYFIPLFLLPMQFGAMSAFVAEPISDFVAPVASAFVYWQRIRYVVGLKPKKAK
ncbi:MATE family efflux transporter [Candidatus Allofournierella excrementigallinarum]|uniref:MATE family efflux transporter n=1 Tax=Candidatus Allofournierella excrementigallinarum TaxID=2838592 RepID=UPI00374E9387